MASLKNKLKTNSSGNYFVDNTCIDCGTCMWIAPKVFKENGDYSSVYSQPQNNEEEVLTLRALFSCPTNSIGYEIKPEKLTEVRESFPVLIEKNIYHLGFHSEKSFGATSYLIQDPRGNILVDSPKFFKPLAEKIKLLGGAKYIFLTHEDDIADHEEYKNFFGAERIIHKSDSNNYPFEILLEDEKDFYLYEDTIFIPTPGHTKGSVCLLYKNEFLFTGDHMAFSDKRKHLVGFKSACWYSRLDLNLSIKKLLNYQFRHVLPGHGFPFNTNNPEEMKLEMKKTIEFMEI